MKTVNLLLSSWLKKLLKSLGVRVAMIFTANINKKLYLQSPYILLSVGYFHYIVRAE